jgi:hypothetical protein
MEALKNFLWPIIVIGGLGAFIDFLIGKTGQERAKDFLFRWWVRFDDVRWRNFGREEALFAGQLIEKWFGRRMYSVRRLIVAFLLLIVFAIVGYSKFLISPDPKDLFCFNCTDSAVMYNPRIGMMLYKMNIVCAYCSDKVPWFSRVIPLFTVIISFCVSVSFIRFITFRVVRLCGFGILRNINVFVLFLLVNYLILAFWSPLVETVKETAVIFTQWSVDQLEFDIHKLEIDVASFSKGVVPTNTEELFHKLSLSRLYYVIIGRNPLDIFAFYYMTVFPSLVRFLISLIFVGSFLLRPLIMHPASLVWRRIVESDKPVFTLMFCGAAAFATAISEAVKHLTNAVP